MQQGYWKFCHQAVSAKNKEKVTVVYHLHASYLQAELNLMWVQGLYTLRSGICGMMMYFFFFLESIRLISLRLCGVSVPSP